MGKRSPSQMSGVQSLITAPLLLMSYVIRNPLQATVLLLSMQSLQITNGKEYEELTPGERSLMFGGGAMGSIAAALHEVQKSTPSPSPRTPSPRTPPPSFHEERNREWGNPDWQRQKRQRQERERKRQETEERKKREKRERQEWQDELKRNDAQEVKPGDGALHGPLNKVDSVIFGPSLKPLVDLMVLAEEKSRQNEERSDANRDNEGKKRSDTQVRSDTNGNKEEKEKLETEYGRRKKKRREQQRKNRAYLKEKKEFLAAIEQKTAALSSTMFGKYALLVEQLTKEKEERDEKEYEGRMKAAEKNIHKLDEEIKSLQISKKNLEGRYNKKHKENEEKKLFEKEEKILKLSTCLTRGICDVGTAKDILVHQFKLDNKQQQTLHAALDEKCKNKKDCSYDFEKIGVTVSTGCLGGMAGVGGDKKLALPACALNALIQGAGELYLTTRDYSNCKWEKATDPECAARKPIPPMPEVLVDYVQSQERKQERADERKKHIENDLLKIKKVKTRLTKKEQERLNVFWKAFTDSGENGENTQKDLAPGV